MSARRELERLKAQKESLALQSEQLRQRCAAAWPDAAKPLDWADRSYQQVRRVPPKAMLLAIPALLLVKKTLLPKSSMVGLVAGLGTFAWKFFLKKRFLPLP